MIAQPQLQPTFALSPVAGQVQVFTCVHRNFFPPVLAQALRNAGQGVAVLIIQFFKGGIGQGPKHPTHLSQNLDWVRCRLPYSINGAPEQADEREAILELWEFAQDAIEGGRYEQVILDELSLSMFYGVIPEAEVQNLLATRPRHVDVVFLGQHMPAAIIQAADQVTNLRNLFNLSLEPLEPQMVDGCPALVSPALVSPVLVSPVLVSPAPVSNVVPIRSKSSWPQPEQKPEMRPEIGPDIKSGTKCDRNSTPPKAQAQAAECWVLPGQLQIPGIG